MFVVSLCAAPPSHQFATPAHRCCGGQSGEKHRIDPNRPCSADCGALQLLTTPTSPAFYTVETCKKSQKFWQGCLPASDVARVEILARPSTLSQYRCHCLLPSSFLIASRTTEQPAAAALSPGLTCNSGIHRSCGSAGGISAGSGPSSWWWLWRWQGQSHSPRSGGGEVCRHTCHTSSCSPPELRSAQISLVHAQLRLKITALHSVHCSLRAGPGFLQRTSLSCTLVQYVLWRRAGSYLVIPSRTIEHC